MGLGKAVVPLAMAQYAAKKLTADETSAVRLEQEYLAEDEMTLLTRAEFWFFWQAHVARAAASLGQSEYVCVRFVSIVLRLSTR